MMMIILYWCCRRSCWEQLLSHLDGGKGDKGGEGGEDGEGGEGARVFDDVCADASGGRALQRHSQRQQPPGDGDARATPRLLSPIPSHDLRQLPRSSNCEHVASPRRWRGQRELARAPGQPDQSLRLAAR